jgi:hypothetical protein
MRSTGLCARMNQMIEIGLSDHVKYKSY